MSSSPAEHEVSDGEEDDPEKGGHETVFWLSQTIFLDVGDEVFVLVDEKSGDTNGAGNADCDEAETDFADVEVVYWGVDKLEDFEEGIVDAVGERSLFLLSVLMFFYSR